jgi:hypothetical protein
MSLFFTQNINPDPRQKIGAGNSKHANFNQHNDDSEIDTIIQRGAN